MPPFAPAHVVALALACFGLGLIMAAFAGGSFGALRLFGGLGLLILAMITSGIQLLTRTGASTQPDDKEGA